MKPRFIEKIADQPRYFAESKLPAERGDRFFLIRQGPGEKGVDSLFFVDPGDRLRDDREGWIERNLRAVSLEETGAKRMDRSDLGQDLLFRLKDLVGQKTFTDLGGRLFGE